MVMMAALPAWAADPADVLKQADGLIQAGHASDAETLLSDGVIRFPRHADLHIRYGQLLDKQELSGLARAHYRAAVTAEPANAKALAAYGHALIAAMESDEALVYLRRAIELDPQYASAAYDLGRILIRSGPEAEAESVRWYDKAMALDPDNVDAQLEYAQLLQLQEKPDRAQTILERVAASKPGNYHLQIRLGRMLVEGGKDKARGVNLLLGAFDGVYADTGPDAEMGRMFYLAGLLPILEQEKRLDEIVPLVEKAIAVRPDSEEGYFVLSSVYVQRKQWDLAIATVERLRLRQPNNPAPDRARAAIEAEQDHWLLARDWYRKAVKRAPDEPDWRQAFGELAEKNKAYAEAVIQYRQLVRLKPKEADSFVHLARALMQSGPAAKPEARKVLQQALQLDKGNDEAKTLLKTLGGGQ
jgi:tetratricopeptide (TPR) repeat protein